jgi:hypothetical protein
MEEHRLDDRLKKHRIRGVVLDATQLPGHPRGLLHHQRLDLEPHGFAVSVWEDAP